MKLKSVDLTVSLESLSFYLARGESEERCRAGSQVGPATSARRACSRTSTRAAACKMVDVGDKPVTDREAIARGSITMSREALAQIRRGAVKKGDPLQAARLAGIMAAKQTSALIPLCHPLPLSSVDVELTPDRPRLRHRGARAHHARRPASRWKR